MILLSIRVYSGFWLSVRRHEVRDTAAVLHRPGVYVYLDFEFLRDVPLRLDSWIGMLFTTF